jgi:hypothetical protein
VRELGHTHSDQVDHVLGVVKSFAQRDSAPNAKLRERWNPGIDAPAVPGRADSGDIEIDLVELLTDIGGLAADLGRGIAIFIDEMQDLGPDDISALCAACHEISPIVAAGDRRRRGPAPPSGGAVSVEVLLREAFSVCPHRPAGARRRRRWHWSCPLGRRTPSSRSTLLAEMYAVTGGYPYFIQAYGKEVWDLAPGTPITREDVLVAVPRGRGRARRRLLRQPV